MPDIFVASDKKAPEISDDGKIAQPLAEKYPFLHHSVGEVPGFASYSELPTKLNFKDEDPDEDLLLFLRKDRITNIPWILTTIGLLFVPFIFGLILKMSTTSPFFISPNLSFVLLGFYYLIVATYAFVNFILWYFNISIVTQKRVIDIDYDDLIVKSVSETKINQVEDVSYSQVGTIRAIFDYGDVLIQTAGTQDKFVLEAVPQPERVVHIIENLIN